MRQDRKRLAIEGLKLYCIESLKTEEETKELIHSLGMDKELTTPAENDTI